MWGRRWNQPDVSTLSRRQSICAETAAATRKTTFLLRPVGLWLRFWLDRSFKFHLPSPQENSWSSQLRLDLSNQESTKDFIHNWFRLFEKWNWIQNLICFTIIYLHYYSESHSSVCMKCTTDYVSFDDFIGDTFDEGVRHRRPGFHKVPPIKRKVEKVFILLISVNSLKGSCPHSAKMSSKATSIVPLFAEPSGTDAAQRPCSPRQWFRREGTGACRTHT